MKFWQKAMLLSGFSAALVGCRGGGNTELIEQEAFQLSEQVLKLEVQVEQLCRELESCRSQLAAEQMQAATDRARDGADSKQRTEDLPTPPKVELGPANGKEPGPAPKFEPKIKPKSSQGTPGVPDTSGPSLPPFHQTSSGVRGERVAYIMLDPQLTEGWDADANRPGDEGLIVVVEPKNEADKSLRAVGEIVITAWDARFAGKAVPPQQRNMAHVGTWNFNARDAATWLEPGTSRFHFELKWPPAGGPKHSDLIVHVQFTAENGRQFEASTQIAVQRTGRREKKPNPPGQSAAAVIQPTEDGLRADTAAPIEFSALKKRPWSLPTDPPPAVRKPPPAPQRKDVSDSRVPVPPEWRPYR
jgi:hypothetical protein